MKNKIIFFLMGLLLILLASPVAGSMAWEHNVKERTCYTYEDRCAKSPEELIGAGAEDVALEYYNDAHNYSQVITSLGTILAVISGVIIFKKKK